MTISTQDQAPIRGGPEHAWLAWTLFVLTIVFLAGALLGMLDRPMPNADVFTRVAFGAFSVVGLLIALRQPDNAIGWLCSAIGVSNSAKLFLDQYIWSSMTGKAATPVPMEWIALFSTEVLTGVGWISMFLVPMLFPSGTFLSRRWRLAGVSALILVQIATLGEMFVRPDLPGYAFPIRNPLWSVPLAGVVTDLVPIVSVLALPLLALCMLASPVLRYRRAHSEERQQLKWMAFAMLPWVLLFAMAILQWVTNSLLPQAFVTLWIALSIVAIPLGIGIAILRYRLYDIDIIIRRTLVYSILSALLALVYFSGVILLQQLFHPLIGPGNDVAIVASTLAIAALFQPLRQRIQAVIDRRFFRRRYDAARTLARFGVRLRDEVQIDLLTSDMLAVVDDILQPAHMSLWLKPRRDSSGITR